jgi:four helix bundle protein
MAISKTRQYDLEERTTNFSVEIINFARLHTKDSILEPMINQLTRSATSVGANYAEANNASSKADFRNKIYLAKKEISETRYWLRLLSQVVNNSELKQLQQEALELNLILQKIVLSLKTVKVNGN